MPFKSRMLCDGRLMHTVASGVCTFEEVRDLRERIRTDEAITEIYDHVVDLTRVKEVTITNDEFVQIREMIIANSDRMARRTALWAGTDASWVPAKVWEEVIEPVGRTYIAFSDLDSICLWLAIDDETRKRIQSGE